MRTKTSGKARLSALLLALIIILSAVTVLPAGAEENSSGVIKNTTTHDIAIVFDNSESMYKNEAWCQALYAIEVFASMVNYDSDKLGVYPMGPISIGKGGREIKERYDISNKDDVKNIEKVYCEKTSKTILKPAYTACEYLQSSDLDEKWLIVLTDGKFYYDQDPKKKRDDLDGAWLDKSLKKFLDKNNNIKVQYIALDCGDNPNDKPPKLNSVPDAGFYASYVTSSGALANELVGICNMIFQRNAIPNISNGSFNIDVSMKNIVAFVQGKDTQIRSLKVDSGKDAPVMMDTDLKAAIEGTGNPNITDLKIADVGGQVVTYGACPAGTYKLDYSGSNLQMFYEPDVAIKTELLDSNGEAVDLSKDIYPGEYTLNYNLVDANTGKEVASSSLLAPVNMTAAVTNNGETRDNVASGSKIELNADSDTDTVVKVSATYLKDYSIDNSVNDEDFKIHIVPPEPEKLSVDVTVTNKDFGHNWYKYSNHEEWTPIRVAVTLGGEKLSDEELGQITTISFNRELKYRAEPVPGESAYDVYIGQDENGEYVQPDSGGYSVTAKAAMTDEYGRELEASDSAGFEVQSYSSIWRWLIYIVAAVALALLIWFLLNLPAWPRKITFVIEKPTDAQGRATVKIRNTNMPIVPVDDALYCNAKKNSKVKDRLFKPRGMSIIATNFTSEEITKFSTGGHVYLQGDGEFKCRGVDNEIIFNGSHFEYTYNNGSKGSGHIEIR